MRLRRVLSPGFIRQPFMASDCVDARAVSLSSVFFSFVFHPVFSSANHCEWHCIA